MQNICIYVYKSGLNMQKYGIKICKNMHKNTTMICKICRSPYFTYFVFICIPYFADDRRPTLAFGPAARE